MPSKNCLKLTLVLPGGAGGALTKFPYKLRLNFFSPPWACRYTHCTPTTPMVKIYGNVYVFAIDSVPKLSEGGGRVANSSKTTFFIS